MKKEYINPEMEVVKVVASHQLLGGSTLSLGRSEDEVTDESVVLSRGFGIDEDE